MSFTGLIPLPYRILALVLLSIALMAFGYVHGLHVGEAKLDTYRLAEQKATVAAIAKAADKTRAMQAQKDEALRAATTRAISNDRAAASARAERDGMRDELTDARSKLSGASVGPLREYAATLSAVFAECVDRYTGMAKAAAGHASDALTFEQAWPK